ncbi:MAG: 3'-5' exonuclease [Bacteroidetes bacterium]|jgi:DNA polymerase III subunit epsilon|nr:3'-5' exonuclease [Bacteroidota bacterium]MBT3750809.1 3'-5' exonuclease [Bacteroidota bacterium]MBT4399873.1 3'-5' exonuclease [Bacteroidota bacterium]MBT4409863.1 3'-5' exonuclease [Bacteroidota bacterium]MBT5426766.1 3'-5' exonuclease [Bacteroidota bacterium]
MPKLKLTKPIVFFDIESTGIDVVSDRIVEISFLKISPDGKEEVKTMRINPTIPIPPVVTEIHGIKDSDVADEPTFADRAKEIASFLKGSDLGGYNSNRFDIPMLAEEFARAGDDIDLKKMRFIDVQVIFFKMEPRSLTAAYKFYCDKQLDNAHSAEADTRATWEVFKSQLVKYPTLSSTIDGLSEFSAATRNADFLGRIIFDKDGVELINFGKHKGKKVTDVFQKEPSYYRWMMDGNFPEYTKRVITRIYLKMREN